MHWYYWLYYVLLLLILTAGVFVNVMLVPGLWLMVAAAAGYALLTHLGFIGWKTLIALLVLALAAEIVELALGGAAAKKAGGGKLAMIGAVIGGIVGGIVLTPMIPIPIVGTVVGVCLGSFLGAMVAELAGGREMFHSLKVGAGAATGRFAGIVSKLAFGFVMWVIAAILAFPVR
jgi:uncharacterized protein YqgC (DUF456 family)